MCGYVVCNDRSTPSRIVWQRGTDFVTWTRITEAVTEPPVAPEPPKLKRLRKVSNATINVQEETSASNAKRRKLDESTPNAEGESEARSSAVKMTEPEDAKTKSDVENANQEEAPQPKYSILPAQYENFYTMIAGFCEHAPIPDVEETLQLELDDLDSDATDRVMGFLGYDPRGVFAELEFSTFEPLKQHALKKVILQEREAKPLFRWAAGRGPSDAPADVRCELEEEPDNMRNVHFLNVMAQRELNRASNPTEDDKMSAVDTFVGDLDSLLEGQFSDEDCP